MNVYVISRHDDFAQLADVWNAMPQAQRSPLARHEWFASAREAFSSGDKLAVTVAKDGDRIRAIAPLVLDRSLGSARFNILGHHTQEPNLFLYSDLEALAAVCAVVARLKGPAVFPRLGVHSDEVRLLRDHLQSGTMRSRGTPLCTSGVKLGSWQALEAAMSSSTKAMIRRKRRLAEREGIVTSEVIVPNEHNLLPLLDEVFRIEGAGWKSRAGTSIIMDPPMRRFYTSYARKAARQGYLRIYFLKVSGHAIATRLAVSFGGTLWELKIGYDERWKNCSPGILLTHDTLRFACEEGLTRHEFLGGAEAWQACWPIETTEYTSLRYYPLSFSGAMSLGLDVFGVVQKRLFATLGRLPPTPRTHGPALKTTA